MRLSERSVIRSVVVMVAVLAALAVPGRAFGADATTTPVADLLEAADDFDGATITVEGELVGDYGFRDNGTMWTQLNDDSYARKAIVDGGARTGANIGIGVRMPAELGEGLDPVGGYRLEGPLVRLTGTWRYHDPDRAGESYLDVVSMVVVEPGRRIQEGPDWTVLAIGALLIGTALLMRWWRRRSTATE